MSSRDRSPEALRAYRNTRIYRPLWRIARAYNKWLVGQLHQRGFEDFSPAFPPLLSNLDTEGTRVGVLARRAGVTRQAAGQLLAEIERRGYAELRQDPSDARASLVMFTPRGRKLLATVLELCDEYEAGFEQVISARDNRKLRELMLALANHVDPGGALGEGDRA